MHRSFPFTAFRVRMTRSRIWRLRPRRSPANAGASWEVQPATTPSDSERVQRTTAASHSEGVLRTTAASHSEGVLRTTEESLAPPLSRKNARILPSIALWVRMTRSTDVPFDGCAAFSVQGGKTPGVTALRRATDANIHKVLHRTVEIMEQKANGRTDGGCARRNSSRYDTMSLRGRG